VIVLVVIGINIHIIIDVIIYMYRRMWQTERGILEGEAFVDMIEDYIAEDIKRYALHGPCIHVFTSIMK
jgi:hypothetical protein